MVYPIPKNSADAWVTYQKTTHPRNVGLIFDHFVQDWGAVLQDKEAKKKAWQEIVAQKGDPELLKAWNLRWEADVRVAHAKPFPLKTDWRFIAGLGSKGPLEVGFTFHRYGFPILPGSSVKGVARAWGLLEIAEALKTDQLNKLDAVLSEDDAKKYQQKLEENTWQENDLMQQFRLIFGTTGAAGGAVFFDALPSNLPKLELDIMNPHYPKYYEGSEPPTDWQSPIPVYFLTVAPQTEFRFAVGWRGQPDKAAQDRAREWLICGLTKLGAGSKTSAGYGYFVPPKPDLLPQSTVQPKNAPEMAISKPTIDTPLVWCNGTIVSIDTSRTRRGKVEDAETKQVYEFRISAIEGNTPGKKDRVMFVIRDGQVTKIRRR